MDGLEPQYRILSASIKVCEVLCFAGFVVGVCEFGFI
jgi:hypothetical protein